MNEYFAIESWDRDFCVYVSAPDIHAVFATFETVLRSGAFMVYPVGDTSSEDVIGRLPEERAIIEAILLHQIDQTKAHHALCVHMDDQGFKAIFDSITRRVALNAYNRNSDE